MQFAQHGRRWETLRGYDIVNEAAVVELRDISSSPTGEVVLCGILPTTTGVLSIEQYRENLPLELLNWFREEAVRLLNLDLPSQDSHDRLDCGGL